MAATTIQPLRSVSTQLPIGRSRSGASSSGWPRAVGRADEDAGHDVVERLGLEEADGGDPATVRRPGRVVRPAAGGEDLARLGALAAHASGSSTSTAQIVVRGWRSGSGPRSVVKAIVRPSGCQAMSETPQSPLVTWRGRAVAQSTTKRCDHRSRWPSSSQRQSVRVMRRARGDGVSATFAFGRAGGDRAGLADDEPRRVDLGGEREAAAVGRPGELADRPVIARSWRAHGVGRALEIEQRDPRGRVVVGRVGADEGERVAVRSRAAAGCPAPRRGSAGAARGIARCDSRSIANRWPR